MYFSGPPRYIFGRQGSQCGNHFAGMQPLPPPFSNLAKDQALAALPLVAALLLIEQFGSYTMEQIKYWLSIQYFLNLISRTDNCLKSYPSFWLAEQL